MSCVSLPTALLDNTETVWLDRTRCEEEFLNFLVKTSQNKAPAPIELEQPPTITQRFEKVKTRLKNVGSGDRLSEVEKRNAYLEERVRSLETELAKYKDSDDDFNLFDDDGDDETELQFEYFKEMKRPKVIARSVLVLDVKTVNVIEMSDLEQSVRNLEIDGLRWANSELEESSNETKFLRISSLLEDEKVEIEELKETIGKLANVESVEVHCFNKI